MIRTSIAACLCSTIFAAPALAEGGHFYAGFDIGAAFSAESDQTWVPGTLAGSTGHVIMESDLGLNASLLYGYDFGWVRLEIEGGYLSVGVDEVTSDFTTGVVLASGSQSAEGDINAKGFMGNVIVDIGAIDDITLFAGAGAGLARLDFSKIKPASGYTLLDDKNGEWLFAWQVMAGARKPISDRIDLHVRYRYVDIDAPEVIGLGGRVVVGGLSSHSLSAGITFNF